VNHHLVAGGPRIRGMVQFEISPDIGHRSGGHRTEGRKAHGGRREGESDGCSGSSRPTPSFAVEPENSFMTRVASEAVLVTRDGDGIGLAAAQHL
jgi:hypothetical protein